jgi:hypothetical protein
MILLALAAVAFLLFAGKSTAPISGAGISGAGVTPIPAPVSIASATPVEQTPVIKNATGGSLSSALGSKAAPPNYYATGNPGYDTQVRPLTATPISKVVVRSGAPFSKADDLIPARPRIPVAVNRGVVGVPLTSPTNPQGTFKPVIAARPVVTTRVGPEVAAAFWTKVAVSK